MRSGALFGVVNLFARDLGGAGNPPLLILHGLLGSSRNWQSAGTDLAAHRHVRALDLRNHGRSPHDDRMDFDVMVEDVLRWMDANDCPVAELMGHSLGGKVAMLLACRHPQRVGRLFVIDIAPKACPNSNREEFAAMNELRLEGLQSRGEAEQQFEAHVSDWAMRKFLATNLERTGDGQWRWSVNLGALTDALTTLEGNPLRDDDRYEGPCLFVTGGKSRYVQSEDHAHIRHHFPAARIETIQESGHNPHMETRAEFVRLVTQ